MAIADQARKCAITIDNTKVSGSANHSNFPVLLTEDNLPSEIFDADGSYPANADGGDIRFSSDSDGATELAREVVEFTRDNDPANGTCQIWVKVPTLDYNDDTVIYIWYNDSGSSEPAIDSTYGSEAVWSNGFEAVYHFPESAGSTRVDSTSNDNDLADSNTVGTVTGKVGNAADFEASSSQSLSITDANQTGLDLTGDLTISCWVKLDQQIPSGGLYNFMSKWGASGSRSWLLRLLGDGGSGTEDRWTTYYNGTAAQDFNLSGADRLTTSFRRVTWRMDNGTADLFIDDTSKNTTGSLATSQGTNSATVYMGVYYNGSQYMDGAMDEFTVASTARSDDWIKTEYANQNAPDTFSSAGTPTSTTVDYPLTAAVGSFTLTGVAANFSIGRTLTAALGEFTLTGIDAVLNKGKKMVAALGEFTLTGQDALFHKTLSMIAAVGTFTLTGIAATFNKGWKMAVSVGTFTTNFITNKIQYWLKRTKPSTTFTGRSKPSTSFTARTKPSTTWTKRDKFIND